MSEKLKDQEQETNPVDEKKENLVEEVKTEKEEIKEETKEEKVVEEIQETVAEEKKKEPLAERKEENKVHENASTLEFDWDNVASKDYDYSTDKRTELEGIYNETLSTISEKEVVKGTIISITDKEVVINIGYKSEGIVSLNEFRYNTDLKIGDLAEVYIENQEDKTGQLILSHKKARTLQAWENINTAMEKDEIIKGFIKCRTKGGMITDIFGIEAFLPGSQIDVKPIRDYDAYVGKTMEFKVVKINHEYKNVVVSHKALIEAELEEQKKKIIEQLEKGQVLEGTVKNITSYGVFIDLGGVDGLIHITDLSWGRVKHPEEIVELDQKLNVVILDFDEAKKRIALGLKQLQPHPWDSLDKKLEVGSKVQGKVVVMADYGAFVEITPGVEGLIHVSEMSWSQHLRSAQEFLKVGDMVEAQILTLDFEERRMSLGIKQLNPDPWEKIDEKYSLNSQHTAKVRNFTNFGVFIELEEGVDGLIHISDLSWTKKIKHPAEFTQIGEDIEIVVLEIDKENRRLSVGHKQLEENPWDVFETLFSIDSVHEGTIISLKDREAIVSLPYGVEGICTSKHLKKEDGSTPNEDEKLEFKVIDFSKEAKKILVSHMRTYKEKTKKRPLKTHTESEKTTLGDISGLAELKDKLNEDINKKAKAMKQAEEKKGATKEVIKEEKVETPKEEKKEVKPKAKKETKEAEDKKEVKEEKKTAAKKETKKIEKTEEPKDEVKKEEEKKDDKNEEEVK